MQTSEPLRFQVALSFPSEYRSRVEKTAEALAGEVGQQSGAVRPMASGRICAPNLDVYLPKLSTSSRDSWCSFYAAAYVQKEWCGLEWQAGRDVLKRQEDDRLMFLRLDRADIPGLYFIDGYLDISSMPDDQVAVEILNRLAIAAGADSSNPPASSEGRVRITQVNGGSEPSAPDTAGQPTPIGARIAEKQLLRPIPCGLLSWS